MITRSLKVTTTAASNPSLISQDYHSSKKSPSKKLPPATHLQTDTKEWHSTRVTGCVGILPNLELIHQIIEAFEDYLTNGKYQKLLKKNARAKQRNAIDFLNTYI
ncbi:hypothetical protein GQ457_09G022360 [Hibiscus cannabinus]